MCGNSNSNSSWIHAEKKFAAIWTSALTRLQIGCNTSSEVGGSGCGDKCQILMDTPGKMDMSNVVIVMVVIVIFFILMSACCRQIRQGCEEQMTLEELARRRQAYYISEASRSLQELEDRSTRVTTIYQDSGGLALGIYEIHVPRSHYPESVRSNRSPRPSIPPPPFNTALQNSTPISYIDPEEPPPSYDDYLKLSAPQPSLHSATKDEAPSEEKPRY